MLQRFCKTLYNLVQNTKVVTRLPQGCHKDTTRLSQGCQMVITLSQGCYNMHSYVKRERDWRLTHTKLIECVAGLHVPLIRGIHFCSPQSMSVKGQTTFGSFFATFQLLCLRGSPRLCLRHFLHLLSLMKALISTCCETH